MKDKNEAAQLLGRLSAHKRMSHLTPEQRKEYMKQVRAKKTPEIAIESTT